MKVVPKKWKSFYLNGHTMGFPPQTQNLEPPRGRSSGVGGATPPPPPPPTPPDELRLIVLLPKKRPCLWFIGFEVRHETRLNNLC